MRRTSLRMHRFFGPLLILTVAFAAGSIDEARAQEERPFNRAQEDRAFNRLEIAVGGTYNVNENIIHDFWEPGYGGELSFLTPFYFGHVEAGGAYHRYEASSDDVPRFDALLAFLGWGFRWEPAPGLSWYNGFRIGNNRMTFDEDTFPGVRNESEFLLGVQSRVTLHLFADTGLFAAAQFSQTYTFIRFRTVYATAGLSTSLSSPAWLRSFLK